MKRLTALAVLAAGVGLVGYALFSAPSDEEQIKQVLDDLARAVSYSEPQNPLQRTAQLNGAFKDIFTQNVSVRIVELGADTTGRAPLGQLGARASLGYQSLELGFSGVSLEAGEAAANVSATAELSGTGSNGPRTDERHTEFRFEKVDGDWRIARVRVSPPEDAE